MIAGARIFVTGGTGYLGTSALPVLCQNTPTDALIVSAARRKIQGLLPRRVRSLCTDLKDFHTYEQELCAADYVLWMAANRRHDGSYQELWSVNVEPIIHAIGALRGAYRLRRLIYVSTISAFDHIEQPRRIIADKSVANPTTDYGRTKLLAEQILLDSGLPVTILRLPFLYGPGYAPKSFLAWYLSLAGGGIMARINYPARLSLLYTADFGRIAAAVMNKAASSKDESCSYLVSDGRIYGVNQLIDLTCRLWGAARPQLLPSVASVMINHMLAYTRWRYWRHAAFDPNYFILDSSMFQKSFPNIEYTEVETGFRAAFADAIKARMHDERVVAQN